MAAFAVLIGAMMGGIGSVPIFFALLAAFLICGAGNAVNDYFDFEIDVINNPARPLPARMLSRNSAHKYSLFLFTTGVILAFFINFPALLLAIFNAILLYLYAASIKRSGGLTKNLTVSYLVASPFLFGGLAVGNPSGTLFLVLVALLVNTSREIVKDIEDIEGDMGHLESLPVRFGFRTSGLIAILFLILSILLSPLPFVMGITKGLYLPFILAADAVLIYSMISLLISPKEKASSVQRLIKKAMLLALLGFFLGSV
jgi:geranylgeranylglycerol-phosphate geranylgeranyltransferase